MINNPWVGYLDRSYTQIKNSVLTRLGTNNPELTDHTSQNPLIVIVDMFAGIAEMLNQYIDNMCREAFIDTARRFTSMVKLVKILDYRIKAASPASADLVITLSAPLPTNWVFPANTQFVSTTGYVFLTQQNTPLPAGTTQFQLSVVQHQYVIGISLGNTDGTAFQMLAIPNGYEDGTLIMMVGGEPWTRVNTLGFSYPTSKHYIVDIDGSGIAYVMFGDNVHGAIPTAGQDVIVNFAITAGSAGNAGAGAVTTLPAPPSIPGGITIASIENTYGATGGSDYEDIERIRTNAPLSIRTLDRMVTYQDYIDVTLQAPGVGKAAVDFNCGKTVDIYIVPIGGGLAQNWLLTSTLNYDNQRRMLTTFLNVLAAGETELKISIKGVSRFRQDPFQTRLDVINALVEWGKFENQDINKDVHLSDIYALVDNLIKVDYHNILELTTIPYARPMNNNIQLVWDREVLPASVTKVHWRFRYYDDGINDWIMVFKNGYYLGMFPLESYWTDPQQTLTVNVHNAGLYSQGMEWEFDTHPYNSNIEITDFTMPHVDANNLTITIEPTLM